MQDISTVQALDRVQMERKLKALAEEISVDLAQLEAYDKWVAFYDEPMYYPYAFKIWQYTDEGKVAGIEGNVDLNISFEEADGVQDE